jgi:hypothetical protein
MAIGLFAPPLLASVAVGAVAGCSDRGRDWRADDDDHIPDHAADRDRSHLGASDRFDRAILEFSMADAEQGERDYKALAAAVKSGRITAQTGCDTSGHFTLD